MRSFTYQKNPSISEKTPPFSPKNAISHQEELFIKKSQDFSCTIQ